MNFSAVLGYSEDPDAGWDYRLHRHWIGGYGHIQIAPVHFCIPKMLLVQIRTAKSLIQVSYCCPG